MFFRSLADILKKQTSPGVSSKFLCPLTSWLSPPGAGQVNNSTWDTWQPEGKTGLEPSSEGRTFLSLGLCLLIYAKKSS